MVISFTVETDGCLPTGQALGDAIRSIQDLNKLLPQNPLQNFAGGVAWDGVNEDDLAGQFVARQFFFTL